MVLESADLCTQFRVVSGDHVVVFEQALVLVAQDLFGLALKLDDFSPLCFGLGAFDGLNHEHALMVGTVEGPELFRAVLESLMIALDLTVEAGEFFQTNDGVRG